MFEAALKITLGHEGGYAFVDGDNGGETYRGIARNFHPNWAGWAIVDRVKKSKGGSLPWNYKIDNPELNRLIEQFYHQKFWKRIHLDKVKDPNLQNFIFDFFVNSGFNGIRVIQSTLKNSFNKPIRVDGKMGTKTVNAINSCNPESLFNQLKKARGKYYHEKAKKGKNSKFLDGWLWRLNSFQYKGVAIASISIIGVVTIASIGFFALKSINA